MAKSQSFTFDGGVLTYWGTQLLAFLVTLLTFGFGYPFGLILRLRWRTKHTQVNGVPLVFTGTAFGLIGRWILWWILTLLTIGIYSFWVTPRLNKWIVEHTDFSPRAPLPATISINGTIYVPIAGSFTNTAQLSPAVPQMQPIESNSSEAALPIAETTGDENLS